MHLFWVITTHPGLPPPSINWQPHSSTIPWPCAIAFHAIPSTSTQGDLDVKLSPPPPPPNLASTTPLHPTSPPPPPTLPQPPPLTPFPNLSPPSAGDT